jgi:Trk-type K+ transport system membrane component
MEAGQGLSTLRPSSGATEAALQDDDNVQHSQLGDNTGGDDSAAAEGSWPHQTENEVSNAPNGGIGSGERPAEPAQLPLSPLGNGHTTSPVISTNMEWNLSDSERFWPASRVTIEESRPTSRDSTQHRPIQTVFIPWHRRARQWVLRHLNYRYIFVTYVVLVPLIAAGLGAAILHGAIPFIDTYYMSTSAFTETGLNSVNMTTMNNGFLAVLFIMIMVGSQVFTVFLPPLIKRRLYWRWYGALIRRERHLRLELSRYAARGEYELDADDEESIYGVDESMHDRTPSVYANLPRGRDAEPPATELEGQERSNSERSPRTGNTDWRAHIPINDPWASLDVEANGFGNRVKLDARSTGGNSVDIDARRRVSGRATSKDLSGRSALYHRRSICLEGNEFARNAVLEFEAMGKLIMLNAIFYGGVLAIFLPLVYAAVVSPPGPAPLIAQSGATTGWFSVFTAVSALHNCGLTLVNTSLVAIANQPGALFLLGVLILMGNTGLPIVLYLLVRLARRLARDKAPWDYLLRHGRKFSVFLFNGAQTLILAIALVILLLIQYVAFLALNLNRSDLLVSYSAGSLVYLGAFQSVCTRNAGFVVVSLRAVSPALLVLFAVMMYLSPVPYVLTLRTSAPSSAAERAHAEPVQQNEAAYASLVTENEAAREAKASPVLREIGKTFGNLLVFDIAWLFLALFVICIAENYVLRNSVHEVETLGTVTVFDILFEVASAYGNVGYSIGVNNNDYSLSGIFSVFSKLVIIATMYGGRIRYTPQSSDEAARFRFDQNMMDVTRSSLLRPAMHLRALERRSSRSIQVDRRPAGGMQKK